MSNNFDLKGVIADAFTFMVVDVTIVFIGIVVAAMSKVG